MPVRLLTDAERNRVGSFPQDIATEDLFYLLTSPFWGMIGL